MFSETFATFALIIHVICLRFLSLSLTTALLCSCFACFHSENHVAAAYTETVSRVVVPKKAVPALPASWQVLLDDYDQYIRQAMLLTGTPGVAVVVVKDSSVVFCKGYGHRDMQRLDTVDAHTVFRIGSLSKGFASVLTGMLVQDSVVQWSDRVCTYFPQFSLKDKAQTQRIELEHILSHTTGLPYHAFTNLIEMGLDVPTINTYFPRLPLTGKEGQMYAYQNVAYSVIEEVLRKATGRSYQDLLQTRIFQAAGMKDASASYISLLSTENKAMPHVYTGVGWMPSPITPFYYNTTAAGGVNASATDMGAWLKLLLGHRPDLVSRATLETVFAPRVRTGGERRYFGSWPGPREAHYALGWRVLRWGEDTIVTHGGSVNGFYGQIALDRANGVGICVLTNAMTGLASDCLPAFFERHRRLVRQQL